MADGGATRRSYEADVTLKHVGGGPEVVSDFHIRVVVDGAISHLTFLQKGSPEDLALVVKEDADGRREIVGSAAEKVNALRQSEDKSVRAIVGLLDKPLRVGQGRTSSTSGPVRFISAAILAPSSAGRAFGEAVGRQGATVTHRRENSGVVQTTTVDTTIGVALARRIERQDGSRVEFADKYSLVAPGVYARTYTSVTMRQRLGSERTLTVTINNLRLLGDER